MKMKVYEYGFTAESGESFAIGEYGYDGRTLICMAASAKSAKNIFENYIDNEYITEESTVKESNADPFDEQHYLNIGMDTQ